MFRGHSLLKAALDTELTATNAGQVGTLELTKQRDGVDGTRWGFTIEPVDVSDKVVGRIYKGQERASVWPCACFSAGVGAALPTHDALDHHGRDAREHGLGHRG